ncbi:MAG: extracellular solute-binding protein [Alicyclobacillus sp.]|nr:extracellular solute-binding protein [Alicyclobacillus sp.]
MKRKVWGTTAASVVLGGALLAGCATGSGNAAANEVSQPTGSARTVNSVTLKLGMWSSSPAEKALVERQIRAFEKQNPNIHVNIQVITGDYLQALQPMLASHTAPDIFYVDASVAPQLESAGVLMPLNSYIRKDKVDVKDFSPSLLKAFEWKGNIYGLPKDSNSLAIEYNPALLAKAGIHQPPKTWEEFEKDARLLKAKQIVPLSMPIDVARYYPFVTDFGGSYYDAAHNQATFTKPANRAGLKFFMDNLENKNIVTPKDLGADWAGVPFSTGKVAMVAEGAWIVPFLHDTAPKLKYGVVPFPSLNGKSDNVVYTVCYAMAKSTQHPDEAAKLLFFMTGKSALRMTAQSGLAIPSRISQQGVFLQKYPNYKAFVDGLKHGIPYQFGTLGQNFVDAINKATEAGVLNKQSPDQVLQQAAQTLQSQQQ